MKGDFASAVDLYEEILKSGFASDRLYYNLGNAYFKSGDYTRAILNYERALLLNPGGADIKYNLKIARKSIVDRMDIMPEFFLNRWYKNIVSLFSADIWGIAAIVFFMIFLFSFVVYVYSGTIGWKKTGFVAALTAFGLAALFLIFANRQFRQTKDRKAIFETYGGAAEVFSKFWQLESQFVPGKGNIRPLRDRMPAIRLTEMYYIAAECLKEKDIDGALRMLNAVREARGLDGFSNIDKDVLQKEIAKEYYREFAGEGQLYFYHKRVGTVNIDGVHANAAYVFPMPDVEIDLGRRK